MMLVQWYSTIIRHALILIRVIVQKKKKKKKSLGVFSSKKNSSPSFWTKNSTPSIRQS